MQVTDINGAGDFYRLPSRVALVGGGGKSTLMYHLAETLAGQGKRVIVTTSTHIYCPQPEYYAATAKEVCRLWPEGRFAAVGTKTGTGKLTQPDEMLLRNLSPDILLVEADGSKGFPAKAPREGEPVIPADTELVICVLGLSALGQRWEDCCHGNLPLGKEKQIFAEADAADLLSRETGGRKGVGNRSFRVVLNQCDDAGRLHSARRIAAMLRQRGITDVFAVSFDIGERAHYRALARDEC